MDELNQNVHQITDQLFRQESGKIVAVLTRIFGLHNLELAEDVMQDSFAKALKDWNVALPANPAGWLMQTAKNKAIDVVRRERYHKEFAKETNALLRSEYTISPVVEQLFMDYEIQDSQLRMIFACCHPALSVSDQITLTLKTCSGFGIQEIAAALLTSNETIKKRLQRAKKTIVENKINFDIPIGNELKNRLDTVLQTLYLIFNEGYNSSAGKELIRKDICHEALRLSLLLTANSYTNHTKCYSLIALMTLLSARFEARLDEQGEIILLEDQDRGKWNKELIGIGLSYLSRTTDEPELSTYYLEAAIVAEHSLATSFATTNWNNIFALYNRLASLLPSPSVLLNRAIVLSKTDNGASAIAEIMLIPDIEKLVRTQYLFPAVLGDLYAQTGCIDKSVYFFNQAIALTSSTTEKKLLEKKLSRIDGLS